jgi:hypothetical protein
MKLGCFTKTLPKSGSATKLSTGNGSCRRSRLCEKAGIHTELEQCPGKESQDGWLLTKYALP